MKQDENKLEASVLVKCNNFAQSEFALILQHFAQAL